MKKSFVACLLLASVFGSGRSYATESPAIDSVELADVMVQNAEIMQSFRQLGVSIVATHVEELNAKQTLYVIDAFRKQGDKVFGQAQLRIRQTRHDENPELSYSTYQAEIVQLKRETASR